MSDSLKKRHQLCKDLYHAGMQRSVSKVKHLLQQLAKIDNDLAIPNFDPPTDIPKVGDMIYLPTRWSIDHGYDDVMGGVGVVMEVKPGISGGDGCFYVIAHEQPGRGYNWEFLGPEQVKLGKDHGNQWARPDPDLGGAMAE